MEKIYQIFYGHFVKNLIVFTNMYSRDVNLVFSILFPLKFTRFFRVIYRRQFLWEQKHENGSMPMGAYTQNCEDMWMRTRNDDQRVPTGEC